MDDMEHPSPGVEHMDEQCPVGLFARRAFLQGAVTAGLSGAGATHGTDVAHAEVVAGADARSKSFPFHGYHQAGIAVPPPNTRQMAGTFASFNVTVADRAELTD